jgi:hypothetical protein
MDMPLWESRHKMSIFAALSRYFLPVPFPKKALPTCILSLRKVKMSRDRVKTKLDKSGEVKAFSQVAMSNNHAVIDYCR